MVSFNIQPNCKLHTWSYSVKVLTPGMCKQEAMAKLGGREGFEEALSEGSLRVSQALTTNLGYI